MTVRTKRQSVSHLWWSGATVANQNDPADGRLARSLRTKRRIVDAALRLIDGDAEKFSAKAVAKRAGVTVRTVFTHYPAIETLLVDISDIVAARFASLIGPIAPSLPLERRIEKFAADQARMFETMRGFHRSIRFWRERSPVIGKRFDCYHDAVREKMRGCFRPELDRISPRSRRHYFEVLAGIGDWEYWDALRHRGGLSVADAQRALMLALRVVLAGMLVAEPPVAAVAG